MNYSIIEIFSYSIIIPVMISIFLLKRRDGRFLPFFVLLWTGLLGELATSLSINLVGSNAEAANIYVLIEALLVLWIFDRWQLFLSRSWVYLIGIGFILAWTLENLVFSSLHIFNSYYRILYSFTLVILSINQINKLLFEENKPVFPNPVFLICIAFVVFFTYKTLVEIFWIYGLNSSRQFNASVYRIMSFINLFANLLYALACLWMPRKREFSLL